MANPFIHIELQSNDLAKARAFYAKLFDWKLEDAEMAGFGSYTMIQVGAGTGGGMMNNPAKGEPSHWLPYVDVADIVSSTRKAKELGAKVALEVTPVGEMGRMSVIIDPSGATLGLWQTTKKP